MSQYRLHINPVGSQRGVDGFIDEYIDLTSEKYAHEMFEQSCSPILNVEVQLFEKRTSQSGAVYFASLRYWNRRESL